jgi:peroxiredoxin
VSSFRICAALVIGLGLAGSLSSCSSPSGRSVRAAGVKEEKDRKSAPDFELKDADGRTVRLSDYRGKVVLLDFWATWCGPCKIEIPWFKEFQRKYKDRGLEIIGVSMDEDGWEVVKPFVSELGINYRIVIGNDDTARLFGGVDALPTTFVIDRDGKIAATHVGLASKGDIEHGIQELLETKGRNAGDRGRALLARGPVGAN